jgi:Spy/CpxP family protein refolding chaperone
MRTGLIMLATAATLGGSAVATPASAQYYHRGSGYHHDWHRGGDWRRDHWRHERDRRWEWRHHHRYGYRGYYGHGWRG